MNFETRLSQLTRSKITQTKLSSRVIETWLNETLTDAGHLEIPGVLLKPESKKPLERYNIGKNQLLQPNCAISLDSSDRIYRALFVYSLGFYEMLSRELLHSPSRV